MANEAFSLPQKLFSPSLALFQLSGSEANFNVVVAVRVEHDLVVALGSAPFRRAFGVGVENQLILGATGSDALRKAKKVAIDGDAGAIRRRRNFPTAVEISFHRVTPMPISLRVTLKSDFGTVGRNRRLFAALQRRPLGRAQCG